STTICIYLRFFFSPSLRQRNLHSFPTRRSSDLPVACWIFAGLFATILKSTGLVEGITWAAYHIGAKGRLYTIITFFACALFATRSEEHTSELQSRFDLVCRLLLEKKKKCRDQHI